MRRNAGIMRQPTARAEAIGGDFVNQADGRVITDKQLSLRARPEALSLNTIHLSTSEPSLGVLVMRLLRHLLGIDARSPCNGPM